MQRQNNTYQFESSHLQNADKNRLSRLKQLKNKSLNLVCRVSPQKFHTMFLKSNHSIQHYLIMETLYILSSNQPFNHPTLFQEAQRKPQMCIVGGIYNRRAQFMKYLRRHVYTYKQNQYINVGCIKAFDLFLTGLQELVQRIYQNSILKIQLQKQKRQQKKSIEQIQQNENTINSSFCSIISDKSLMEVIHNMWSLKNKNVQRIKNDYEIQYACHLWNQSLVELLSYCDPRVNQMRQIVQKIKQQTFQKIRVRVNQQQNV